MGAQGIVSPAKTQAIATVSRRRSSGEDRVSDLDIARRATWSNIADLIEARLGIDRAHVELYGHYKGKLSHEGLASVANRPDGKLVLVTGINPTPPGEGKTT